MCCAVSLDDQSVSVARHVPIPKLRSREQFVCADLPSLLSGRLLCNSALITINGDARRSTTDALLFCAMRCFSTALFLVVAACGPAPSVEDRPTVVTRGLGSWQGQGDQTIGIVSESGRLRVRWETSRPGSGATGRFRLALHSAVSGRPIQLIADVAGEAHGTVDVAEDPRPYNFMVESANLVWSFTVEEIVTVPSKP